VGDGGGLGSGGAMTTGVKLIDDDAGAARSNRLAVLLAPAKQHIGIDLMPTCHAVDRLALDISLGQRPRAFLPRSSAAAPRLE